MLVDLEFLLKTHKHGTDFVMTAAEHRIELFEACVQSGWVSSIKGTFQERDFYARLKSIKDPERVIHILSAMVVNGSTKQTQDALFRTPMGGEPAIRSLLGGWSYPATEWRPKILSACIDLGVDLNTEFTYKSEAKGALKVKHTLLSSLVIDLGRIEKSDKQVNTNFDSTVHLSPIKHVLSVLKIPDKLSVLTALKQFNLTESMLVFDMFKEYGQFNASDALASLTRFKDKIPPENLAALQAMAARQAIDEITARMSPALP